MRGACLCGQVTFTLRLPLSPVVACHCSQCRKMSGHVWAASSVPVAQFRLTHAQGLAWFRSSDKAVRGFCKGCGSSLFWRETGQDVIYVAAGALEGPTGLALGENWHVADAADYHDPLGGPPPAPSHAETLHGTCLCGANRFHLPGPMGEVTACHCRQCRKTSGHHSASFDADEASLHWSARHQAEHRSPGGATRGFCPTCGSSLWFRAADGAFSLECGAIANPTGGRLAAHIFTADKGDYYGLTDGLPQHPGAGE